MNILPHFYLHLQLPSAIMETARIWKSKKACQQTKKYSLFGLLLILTFAFIEKSDFYCRVILIGTLRYLTFDADIVLVRYLAR